MGLLVIKVQGGWGEIMKRKNEVGNILGQIGFVSSGTGMFSGLTQVSKTGGRAMIIGEPAHHDNMPQMEFADLMGGKKLIMRGKDKGKIIWGEIMTKKNTSKDMIDIMKTGVVWGVSSSVVGSLPATTTLGATTKNFAQAGLSISYINNISKKMKI